MSSGAEAVGLIDALMRLSILVQRAFDRRAADQGISPSQARMLQLIADRAPTINELALLLGLDKSSTSGLVDRAQRRGLVRRVPSQLDRRSVRVRLTDQGRESAEQVASRFAQDLTALLEPLSPPEREVFTASAGRLLRD
ncbi:MAG: MarR family winged helix-turn-helix transcriptional regulator [Solirubrobacteraceae bacterium]